MACTRVSSIFRLIAHLLGFRRRLHVAVALALPLFEIRKWNYEPDCRQHANDGFSKSTSTCCTSQTQQTLALEQLKNLPHSRGLWQNQIFKFRAEAFVETSNRKCHVLRRFPVILHSAVEVVPKCQGHK